MKYKSDKLKASVRQKFWIELKHTNLSSYRTLGVYALFAYLINRLWDFFFFPCFALLHTLLLPLLPIKFISLNVDKKRYWRYSCLCQNPQRKNN